MKILILTQWYPPEPAILLQELAQTLMAKGHEVTVLTGFPNYPMGKIFPGYRQRLFFRETLEGVQVIRVPLYIDHSLSPIKRVLNYLTFALSSALFGFWLSPRPHVLFVYHPPLTIGLSAWILSRLWGVRFVYQVQDMWPESLSATGMVKGQYLLSLIGCFARWVYARAHSVLVISPGFKSNLIQKGVPDEKIRVVSNWMEGAVARNKVSDLDLARRLELIGRFNIMFAGNIGEAQGLETVLNAAEIVADLEHVQFVLIGDGLALPRLKELAKAKALSNVRFLGRFNPDVMPALYTLADVLLVHLKDEPLFRITIPHKIMTYLGTGKPILAAIEGDAADVIIDSGAGLICRPGDPFGLADAVRSFALLSDTERASMGARGLHIARTRFSRESLVAEIEAALMQASANAS